GDLESLDRDLQLAGLLVEGDDASVDLLTDREALRTLLVAVTRQVSAADEGLDVVVDQTNVQTAVLDVDHFAGHDSALAQFTRSSSLAERVTAELLDAERDALLLDVDVENLSLDDVTAVVLLDDLLARTVPVEIRQVHHAVDVALEANEQAEL